jgi:hypothetical protein
MIDPLQNTSTPVTSPTPETIHEDFFGGPVEAIETLTAPAPSSIEPEIPMESDELPAVQEIVSEPEYIPDASRAQTNSTPVAEKEEEIIPAEVEETSDDVLDFEPLPELVDEPREEDITPEEVSSPEEEETKNSITSSKVVENSQTLEDIEEEEKELAANAEEEAVHVREEEPEDAPTGSALLQKFLELFRITQEAYAVKADDETLDIL